MRYELQIVTDAHTFPTAEGLVEAAAARGLTDARIAAQGGFGDPASSPRVLVEESSGGRVLVGFEKEGHARFLAEALLAAPEPLLARLDGYDRACLGRAKTAYRLSVSQGGKSPADAVQLQVHLADALLDHAGHAVLLDSQMQLLFGAARWRSERALGDIDVRRHVVIHAEPAGTGFWMHTHGLIKFDRPDLEIFGVAEEQIDAGATLLNHFARLLASGGALRAGELAELPGGAKVKLEQGGRPPHDFEGEALQIVDERGRADGQSVARALAGFAGAEE